MTDSSGPTGASPFLRKAQGYASRVIALLIAGVAVVLTVAAAGVIAIAALAVSAIAAIGVGILWLVGRFARPRPPRREGPGDDQTLEARKGPRGWTVEARRFSF